MLGCTPGCGVSAGFPGRYTTLATMARGQTPQAGEALRGPHRVLAPIFTLQVAGPQPTAMELADEDIKSLTNDRHQQSLFCLRPRRGCCGPRTCSSHAGSDASPLRAPHGVYLRSSSLFFPPFSRNPSTLPHFFFCGCGSNGSCDRANR